MKKNSKNCGGALSRRAGVSGAVPESAPAVLRGMAIAADELWDGLPHMLQALLITGMGKMNIMRIYLCFIVEDARKK